MRFVGILRYVELLTFAIPCNQLPISICTGLAVQISRQRSRIRWKARPWNGEKNSRPVEWLMPYSMQRGRALLAFL